MTSPPHLRVEDRPDFERLLRQALTTAEIREALRRDSIGHLGAERLRSQALQERAAITAAAGTEYGTYLRLRAATELSGTLRSDPRPAGGRGLLPALGVLVPVLAAVAAVVFLLLGYALGFSDTRRDLADSLLDAGRTAVVVAAVTTGIGVTAVLVTATRHRSSPPDGHALPENQEVDPAREAWRQVLLERGILPFLHAQLHDIQPSGGTGTVQRSPVGFTSPDFAGPDYAGPDFTTSPHHHP